MLLAKWEPLNVSFMLFTSCKSRDIGHVTSRDLMIKGTCNLLGLSLLPKAKTRPSLILIGLMKKEDVRFLFCHVTPLLYMIKGTT